MDTRRVNPQAESVGDLTPAEQFGSGLRAPALDGLRGAACLMVLLHHCGCGHATSLGARLYNRVSAAGWAGVDLFFVLSGFLITGLLLEARGRTGGLRRFWFRRAVRILPLAYAYLAVVFFSPLWQKEPWHPGVYAEQWWFWLYANNWLALYRPSLDHGLLGHFWSLAIEEQFYLLWPIAVLCVSLRRLETFCVVVVSASVVGHLWASALHVRTDLVHSLTPARLDGLVLGSWLTLFRARTRTSKSQVASHRWRIALAGTLGILLLLPARGLPAGHPWVLAVGSPALAIIFTMLLSALLNAPRGAIVRRFFEARALAALGRISYGFYVLHVAVVASLRRHWNADSGSLLDCLSFVTIALFASAALATVTWFAFERPLLRLRQHASAPRRG
jgi:peptidoglycan/LPS O-acetylase OafA/YrhL